MSASSDAGATPAPNALGRVSLVLGIVIVVVQLGQSIVAQLAPLIQVNAQLSASSIGLLFLPFQIVAGLLAVAAVITGALGLTRRGLARGAAGAGTALGASALFLLVANLVASLIYRVAL